MISGKLRAWSGGTPVHPGLPTMTRFASCPAAHRDLEGLENLKVALPWFDGSDHKEAIHVPQPREKRLAIHRNSLVGQDASISAPSAQAWMAGSARSSPTFEASHFFVASATEAEIHTRSSALAATTRSQSRWIASEPGGKHAGNTTGSTS